VIGVKRRIKITYFCTPAIATAIKAAETYFPIALPIEAVEFVMEYHQGWIHVSLMTYSLRMTPTGVGRIRLPIQIRVTGFAPMHAEQFTVKFSQGRTGRALYIILIFLPIATEIGLLAPRIIIRVKYRKIKVLI
jgi:hypothetical protein